MTPCKSKTTVLDLDEISEKAEAESKFTRIYMVVFAIFITATCFFSPFALSQEIQLSAKTPTIGFNNDGSRFVTGFEQGQIQLWSRIHGIEWQPVSLPGVVGANLAKVSISPDGRLAAAGLADGSIRLYDTEEKLLLHNIQNPVPVAPRQMVFSTSGGLLHVVGVDNVLRQFDTQTGQATEIVLQPVDESACFSNSGDLLARPVGDDAISLIKLTDGTSLPPLTARDKSLELLRFSPDDARLAGIDSAKTLFLWDITRQRRYEQQLQMNAPVTAIWFEPSGRAVNITNSEGTVWLCDPLTGVGWKQVKSPVAQSDEWLMSPDGSTLAMWQDGSIDFRSTMPWGEDADWLTRFQIDPQSNSLVSSYIGGIEPSETTTEKPLHRVTVFYATDRKPLSSVWSNLFGYLWDFLFEATTLLWGVAFVAIIFTFLFVHFFFPDRLRLSNWWIAGGGFISLCASLAVFWWWQSLLVYCILCFFWVVALVFSLRTWCETPRFRKIVTRIILVGLVALILNDGIYAVGRLVKEKTRPGRYYGGERGDLQYGTCDVTIPQNRSVGKLQTPFSVFSVEFPQNEEKHVVLQKVIPESENYFETLKELLDDTESKEVLVFVHGYNTTFEDAVRRTAQITHDLKFQGAPICYSWPSQGLEGKYFVDSNTVTTSVPHLASFLDTLSGQSGAKKVHIIGHSMGGRVVARALKEMEVDLKSEETIFQEVILAAPDIDTKEFMDVIVPAISDNRHRTTLYSSSNDNALSLSKTFNGAPRAGDSGDLLVVVDGVETVDASEMDTGFDGHSYVFTHGTVISDVFDVLHKGDPPDDRFWLERKLLEELPYWTFRR